MPPSNQPKSGVPFATPRISSLIESEVFAKAVEKLAEETVGNMPAENYYQFVHGNKWNYLQYDENGKVREASSEMQCKSAQITIQKQNITEQKADLIQESISSVCSAMGNQMNSSIYETMKESAEQSGLTFTFPPSGILIEQYFDLLSKWPLSISKIGELNWPMLFNIPQHLHDKLQFDLENAPQEFKTRLADLLAKKEAEARQIENARLARFDSTE